VFAVQIDIEPIDLVMRSGQLFTHLLNAGERRGAAIDVT
jgi:hypothetical protein